MIPLDRLHHGNSVSMFEQLDCTMIDGKSRRIRFLMCVPGMRYPLVPFVGVFDVVDMIVIEGSSNM